MPRAKHSYAINVQQQDYFIKRIVQNTLSFLIQSYKELEREDIEQALGKALFVARDELLEYLEVKKKLELV